jgi:hypothetical protein
MINIPLHASYVSSAPLPSLFSGLVLTRQLQRILEIIKHKLWKDLESLIKLEQEEFWLLILLLPTLSLPTVNCGTLHLVAFNSENSVPVYSSTAQTRSVPKQLQ